MKTRLFMLWTLLASVMCANAANNVTVADVTVPQGGTGSIDIVLNNSDVFTAFSMKLVLPDDISYVSFEKGNRFSDHAVSDGSAGDDKTFACLSLTSAVIAGTSGTLLKVNVSAGPALAVGTELTATLSELTFTTPDAVEKNLDDVTIHITIGESGRTLLDESSTVMPSDATDVDVRVKRTIKANEWSTLVLPFDMSEAQVKTAFGNDVKLASFTGWSSEEDDDGNIVSISVGFTSTNKIVANTPCLIKTNVAISEFTVDGVTIEAEEEPTVQVGTKRAERGYLIGTYVANTTVPSDDLFLNGNRFYYSAGKTKMKAFRAYFELADELTDKTVSAPFRMIFEDEETSIQNMTMSHVTAGSVYTLQGIAVGNTDVQSLPRGIYIMNGKKVSVK
ncbi:MAG: hypothetical protein IJV33_05735 [Bacteroidaceae bacterium]|nr:hypothetical protein [Bacteroidaceae bacterium]